MGDKQSTLKPEKLSDLSRDTSFTEDEIAQWYRDFVKTCRDGKTLSQDDFRRTYVRIFPQGDASVFAGHVFRSFDTNKDGHLDFREFLSLVMVTRRGSPEQKLRWVFRIYDIDDDGYVTKDEMHKVISAMHRMAGKGTRFPSAENTPEKRTEKIFVRTDRNDDQRLSFEEFSEGAVSDPLIAQLLNSNDP